MLQPSARGGRKSRVGQPPWSAAPCRVEGDRLPMMNRAVHWHEGMFLRPHHLNASQQHWEEVMAQNAKWNLHYNWGLRSIELDLDALANYRLVIRSLRARLRDGTLISVPEDGVPPAIDLKGAFEKGNLVTVLLALPLLNPGKGNVAAPGVSGDGVRFLLDTQNLIDVNTGVNPQPIKVRLLN